MVGIHICEISLCRFYAYSLEIIVKRVGGCGGKYRLVKILVLHIESTLYKVTKRIYKVGIVSCKHAFPSDRAVGCVGHFGKGVIAHAVNADVLGELICVNNVALGLGHLIRAEIEPRMTEYLFGQGQIKCHKENGPIDGVEADDVLTYNVNVGGPILTEMLALLLVGLVGIVADGGDVVGERIKPYVSYVLGV